MTSPNPPSPAQTAESESFVLTLPDDPASGKDWYLWAGVLAILVFVAFLPAATGSLVWDDDHHAGLIANFPTLDGLIDIWTPGKATPQYYPLTFTTFWLEFHLWHDNPLGYHIGNLLLHAGAAILVWRLLKRLALPGGGSPRRSGRFIRYRRNPSAGSANERMSFPACSFSRRFGSTSNSRN